MVHYSETTPVNFKLHGKPSYISSARGTIYEMTAKGFTIRGLLHLSVFIAASFVAIISRNFEAIYYQGTADSEQSFCKRAGHSNMLIGMVLIISTVKQCVEILPHNNLKRKLSNKMMHSVNIINVFYIITG